MPSPACLLACICLRSCLLTIASLFNVMMALKFIVTAPYFLFTYYIAFTAFCFDRSFVRSLARCSCWCYWYCMFYAVCTLFILSILRFVVVVCLFVHCLSVKVKLCAHQIQKQSKFSSWQDLCLFSYIYTRFVLHICCWLASPIKRRSLARSFAHSRLVFSICCSIAVHIWHDFHARVFLVPLIFPPIHLAASKIARSFSIRPLFSWVA